MNVKGITLVGMPGSGKSTAGKALAKSLGWDFIDLDIYIKEKTGRGHEVILDEDGEKALLALEENFTLGIDLNRVVFSPGGSIIYSRAAMKKLKEETLVVYLETPLAEVKKRLAGIIHRRGIVGLKEKGIARLFKERTRVYKKTSDLTVKSGNKSPAETAAEIIKGTVYLIPKTAIKYYSTNGKSRPATFREALFTGLADDGGLFMPGAFPPAGGELTGVTKSDNFRETAFKLCREYISDITDKDLKEIIRDSFGKKAFPVKDSPAPLVRLTEGLYILELFHGPTLSFKDFGTRFMARLMEHYLAGSKERLAVIVATSGDTGSAAAQGFFGLPGIKVFVLYPEGRISPLQEKQLATLGGNITALKVRGDFDDCQRLAKQALADAEIRGKTALSSANSINIGRLLPQMFYYFSAVSRLAALRGKNKKAKPVFVVPSGNFGDLSAGLFAKKMGLPARKFIAAVNINSGVPRYLAAGTLPRAKTRMTLSSAMDVGTPSNFARILAMYHNDRAAIKRDIEALTVTDAETERTIGLTFKKFGYTADPHTATAITAALNCDIPGPKIVLATAHPAKFPDIVSRNTSRTVKTPTRLAACMKKRNKSTSIPADFHHLKKILLSQ